MATGSWLTNPGKKKELPLSFFQGDIGIFRVHLFTNQFQLSITCLQGLALYLKRVEGPDYLTERDIGFH